MSLGPLLAAFLVELAWEVVVFRSPSAFRRGCLYTEVQADSLAHQRDSSRGFGRGRVVEIALILDEPYYPPPWLLIARCNSSPYQISSTLQYGYRRYVIALTLTFRNTIAPSCHYAMIIGLLFLPVIP